MEGFLNFRLLIELKSVCESTHRQFLLNDAVEVKMRHCYSIYLLLSALTLCSLRGEPKESRS